MDMAKQVKNYVDNEQLKKMLIEFNDSNYLDDGTWIIPYMKKARNKMLNGTYTKEEYELKKDFAQRFIWKNAELRRQYYYGTPKTKKKMRERFERARTRILEPIYMITEGRIRKMKLYASPKLDYDVIQDIKMNAVMKVLDYLNRFDGERGTSAFAYITQECFSYATYYLNQYNEYNTKYISRLDFIENINTIDDYRGNGKTSLAANIY